MSARAERKRETRRRLKEAAVDCFAEQGMSTTVVGTIARRAGVAHGTFYVHFDDKEALLDELVADFQQALVARLEPVWEAHAGDDPRLLRSTAEAFLDHWMQSRTLVRAIAQRLAAGLSFEGLRDGVNRPAMELVEAWVGRWADARGRAALSPARRALLVQGLLAMWGRIGMQQLFREDVSRGDAVEMLVRMSHGAVLAATEEDP